MSNSKTGEQLAWLQQQLLAHPIPQGLSPDDWLLWRTKVGQGMDEVVALHQVFEASSPALFQQQQLQQPTSSFNPGLGALDQQHLTAGAPLYNTGTVFSNDPQHPQPQHQLQPPQQDQQWNGGVSFGDFGSSLGVANGVNGMFNPLVDMIPTNSVPSAGSASIPNIQHPPNGPIPGSFDAPIEVDLDSDMPDIWASITAAPAPSSTPAPPTAPAPATAPFVAQPVPTSSTSVTSIPNNAPTFAAATSIVDKAEVVSPTSVKALSLPATTHVSPPQSNLTTPKKRKSLSPTPSSVKPVADLHEQTKSPGNSSIRIVDAPVGKRSLTPQSHEADLKRPNDASDSSSISKPKNAPNSAVEAKDYMRVIEEQLQASHLSRNKPAAIFKFLRQRYEDGGAPSAPQFSPSPEELGHIFQSLFDRASDSYLSTMADKDLYTETIVRWIRMFSKEPQKWEPAIAPLMLMLSRTDMPVNFLKEYRVPNKVKTLVTKSEETHLSSYSNIDRAYQKYLKYVKDILLPKNRTLKSDSEDDGVPTKRRKVEDPRPKPTAAKAVPSSTASKATLSSTSTSASKFAISKAPASRTDTSFFNLAKPKAPVPSFTKKKLSQPPPPPVAAVPTGPSLLASTMKAIKKAESPPLPTPLQEQANLPKLPVKSEPKPTGRKLNKKGHAVKWVDEQPTPPREFVAIRLFSQEAHELEAAPWQEQTVHGMSTHALDRQEGAAMRHHSDVEEVIDWYEPEMYDAPYQPAPISTPEVKAQEQRERAILSAPYEIGRTLETGDDSDVRHVHQDINTRMMNTTRVYIPTASVPPPAPAQPSVADLLKSINLPNLQPQSQPQPAPAQPYGSAGYGYSQQPPAPAGYNANSSAPYGQPQGYGNAGYGQAGYGNSTNANANAGYNTGYGNAAANGGNNQNRWNGNKNNNNRNNPANRWNNNSGNNNASRWNNNRGGAGGGPKAPNNNHTLPCKFWPGDCRKGDQCNYRHD